jgi:hypothetical protein
LPGHEQTGQFALQRSNSTVVLVVFDTVVDLARVDAARAARGEAVKGLKENYWVGLMSA